MKKFLNAIFIKEGEVDNVTTFVVNNTKVDMSKFG